MSGSGYMGPSSSPESPEYTSRSSGYDEFMSVSAGHF